MDPDEIHEVDRPGGPFCDECEAGDGENENECPTLTPDTAYLTQADLDAIAADMARL